MDRSQSPTRVAALARAFCVLGCWFVVSAATSLSAITLSEPSLDELPDRPILSVRFDTAPAELSTALGEILPAVYGFALEQGLVPGLAFSRSWWIDDDRMFLEAGIEVNRATEAVGDSPLGPIRGSLLPSQRTATADHHGPYHELGTGHVALQTWWAERDLIAAGPPVEYYVTDPTTEPDPSKWLTRIHHPVVSREEVEATFDGLAGRWVGGDADRWIEEVWSPVAAGEALGTFRMQRRGAPVFYELMTIETERDAPDAPVGVTQPRLTIRHFGPGLVAWEEKDETVQFVLGSLAEGHVVWTSREGDRLAELSYVRQGDALEVTLHKSGGEESPSTTRFSFARRSTTP